MKKLIKKMVYILIFTFSTTISFSNQSNFNNLVNYIKSSRVIMFRTNFVMFKETYKKYKNNNRVEVDLEDYMLSVFWTSLMKFSNIDNSSLDKSKLRWRFDERSDIGPIITVEYGNITHKLNFIIRQNGDYYTLEKFGIRWANGKFSDLEKFWEYPVVGGPEGRADYVYKPWLEPLAKVMKKHNVRVDAAGAYYYKELGFSERLTW